MKRDHRKGEEGIVLVVALVILLVLTVIGFVAISTTIFESNIAGNEQGGDRCLLCHRSHRRGGIQSTPGYHRDP